MTGGTRDQPEQETGGTRDQPEYGYGDKKERIIRMKEKFRRILTIQDLSCVGQCSLTVALPVLSACGVEAAVLPGAVLSTHTGGFAGRPVIRDLTDLIPEARAHWKEAGIRFDALLTGYLAGEAQVDAVLGLLEDGILHEGAPIIVDPAMADHGKLYQGFSEAFPAAMRKLCSRADIILPNLTEACLMTGTEYGPALSEEKEIRALIDKLDEIGAETCILKGVSLEEGKLGAAVRTLSRDETRFYFTERVPKQSHGTGDCFAAAFTGAKVLGKSAFEAAALAADFVVECLEQTMDDPAHWYGVHFEQALPMLTAELNSGVMKSRRAAERVSPRRRFVLDGSRMQDKESFYREVNRVLTGNSAMDEEQQYGGNLDAFNDILRGGFGRHGYGEPIELVWEHYSDAEEMLPESFLLKVISIILNPDEDHDCTLKLVP